MGSRVQATRIAEIQTNPGSSKPTVQPGTGPHRLLGWQDGQGPTSPWPLALRMASMRNDRVIGKDRSSP